MIPLQLMGYIPVMFPILITSTPGLGGMSMVFHTNIATEILVMPGTALQSKLDQTPFLYRSVIMVSSSYCRLWRTQRLTGVLTKDRHIGWKQLSRSRVCVNFPFWGAIWEGMTNRLFLSTYFDKNKAIFG